VPAEADQTCVRGRSQGGCSSPGQKEATRRKTIKDVIELWLESESPYENEQARVLLKFVSKLRISNDVLLEWITKRPAVYHQASDLLLEYIAEHWSKV